MGFESFKMKAFKVVVHGGTFKHRGPFPFNVLIRSKKHLGCCLSCERHFQNVCE